MKLKRIDKALGRIAISVIIIGALFKIMHWNEANIILIIGFSVLAFSAILTLVLGERKLYNWLKAIAIILYGGQAIFRINHYPYGMLLAYAFWISLILYLITWFNKDDEGEIVGVFSPSKLKKNWLAILTVLLICLGGILKIMHWPHAKIILLFGMTAAVVWAIKDLFLKQTD